MFTFSLRISLRRAKRSSLGNLRHLAFLLIVFVTPALAATITVTGTGDTIGIDGMVTLGEAITSVNNGANVNADVVAVGAYGTSDTINFNITGAGVRTITTTSAFPTISKAVTIDGYSQSLASPNSNGTTSGSNAVILISLDASSGLGLNISAGPTTIRGLAITPNGSTGIFLDTGSDGSRVEGVFIGTNAAGTSAAVANSLAIGILVFSNNNTIGDTTAATRNVISGNLVGINLGHGASNNVIAGNLIGTNAAGTAAIPNGDYGVDVVTPGGTNVIGGTTAAARNVISGNGIFGVVLEGGPAIAAINRVEGNYIGLDVTGTSALGNGKAGVQVSFSSMDNIIGGTSAGSGNVISGNGSTGSTGFPNANVDADGTGSSGTLIQGNLIGPNAVGTGAPTGLPGVATVGVILGSGATLGGTVASAANVIAFNPGAGVLVPNTDSSGQGSPVQGAAILGNSIFSNGQLGIDLGGSYLPAVGDGTTANDHCDADTGPNNLQNAPTLTSAPIAGGNVTISGTLDSAPSTTFRVEFFANASCNTSGHGEGRTFLGSANVTTASNCVSAFGPLAFAVPAGQTVITASATDSGNNTSEFSTCFTAASTAVSPPTITKAFGAASIPLRGSTTLQFSLTNPNAVSALTGVEFSDALPAGMIVSTPNGITGTCGGGVISATPGGGTVTLSTATLAAGASCLFSANVVGTSSGAKNNNVTVNSNESGAGNTSSASVTVLAPPTIAQVFGTATLALGGSTTLSFDLTNPNSASTLTGVGFTDVLPIGLVVSTPGIITGGCGGGAIVATAGSNSIGLSGASLTAGQSCQFAVSVTAAGSGVQNNVTGVVTSNEGGNGGTASASIVIATIFSPVIAPALEGWTLALLGLLVALVGMAGTGRRRRN
jgi:hypothetical protein